MESDISPDQQVVRLPDSSLVFLAEADFSNEVALSRLQRAGITTRLDSLGGMIDVRIPSRGVGIRVEAFSGLKYSTAIETFCSQHPSIRVLHDAASLDFVTWRQAVDVEHPQFLAAVFAALLS
jgi:hypothetical protein